MTRPGECCRKRGLLRMLWPPPRGGGAVRSLSPGAASPVVGSGASPPPSGPGGTCGGDGAPRM
eukprot:4578339-Alexandrium_andersonii.AAC.1